MRLTLSFFGIITCGCLALTPAFAGQRGSHGTPTHSLAPAHPATSTPHPAPVLLPEKIAANPALVARLQPLVPSGVTLAAAATGFKNQGQFIAALHVSHNLNIPFAQLKAEMTGADHDGLGQAIHNLQPTANAKAAARTAEQQSDVDLKAAKPTKSDHPARVLFPEKIAANPALVARLQPLVPSGMTLAAAATGFKNEGQFIAALHVSHNLNIPFAQLKAEMTGADHDGLGQAIHDLQPTANTKVAARTAEQQSDVDLKTAKPTRSDTDTDKK